MICAVIKGPSFKEAFQQIEKIRQKADLIELRLDLFAEIDPEKIQQLRQSASLPAIFTLRSRSQGGSYSGSEKERMDKIRLLAALHPEYLDLEDEVPAEYIREIRVLYPRIKIILSHHDFEQTPFSLDEIYQGMMRKKADLYKMAFMAKNGCDSVRLLSWARTVQEPLIAISMGEYGQLGRIVGPLFDRPITYASVDDETASAPGQLTVSVLNDRYHYRKLNPQSGLYGLIGLPVNGSVSDVTHNAVYDRFHINAVYVKIPVQPQEIREFLEEARKLPFKGLSVTMPLKEVVIPCLDACDPMAKEIGAVNTLVFNEGKITGYNTDGMGALNAIENKMPVRGKRMVLLGAGGAAKAIAFEANRRGACLTVINRTVDKAKSLADLYRGAFFGWDQMQEVLQEGYDIVVNTSPVDFALDSRVLFPDVVVMDIKTRPKMTRFLDSALNRGCKVVYGYEMFVEQAIGQFDLWFPGQMHLPDVKTALYSSVLRGNL